MTSTTDSDLLTRLLAGADNKLAERDFDGATSDYRQALDLAEQQLASLSPETDQQQLNRLRNQATEGLDKVRSARSGAQPAERLRAQLKSASTDERRLIVLQQLCNMPGGADTSDRNQFDKYFKAVGRHILSEARQALLSQNIEQARERLAGWALNTVAVSREEHEAADAILQQLHNNESWQRDAAQIEQQIAEQLPTSSATTHGDGPRERAEAAAPLPEAPALSVASTSAENAEQLVTQAESYLRRPTAQNYKEAIAALDQALGRSALTPARRSEIEARRATALQAYEQFRDQYGQLTTARQIENIELELIKARELQIIGAQVGPEGEDLDQVISDGLAKLRERLLRVGGERAAIADRLVEDGRNFLDVGALHDAVSRYERVISLLQGKEIDTDDSAQTTNSKTAVASIRNKLLEYPDIRNAIRAYEERREAVLRLPSLLERILPPYREAERAYNEGRYHEALKQIDQVRALIGDRLPSTQFDLLDSYVRRALEANTAAKIQALLDSAQIALSRDDVGGVETAIQAVRLIEPQFQSELVHRLRAEASALIEQVHESERALTSGLNEAQNALARGDLDAAAQGARTVLLRRPASEQARNLLDSTLHQQIDTVLRDADQLAESSSLDDLSRISARLLDLPNKAQQIGDLARRHALSERIKDTSGHISRRIEQQKKAAEHTRQIQAALSTFESHIQASQFDEASRAVQQARSLAGNDPRVLRAEANLKTIWSASLRRRAADLLAADPPQVEAALNELVSLDKLIPGDTTAAELRRKASQIQAQLEAQAAFDRGNFSAVIAILHDSANDTPDSRTLLSEARRREVYRLASLEQWPDLLTLLGSMDTTEAGLAGLFQRATGECALRQATEQLREKQFDRCDQSLVQAEQQRIDDISKRAAALRERANAARKIYARIEALLQSAQAYEHQFEASQNRERLLDAIRQLEQALADPDLLPGDRQRDQIQQLRSRYESRYQELITTERRRLLDAASHSLSSDQLAEARAHFQAVQALTPSGQDPEAGAGLQRVQRRLIELRAHMVEDVAQMLNLRGGGQRGIMPAAIQARIAEIEVLNAIDSNQVDGQLNRSKSDLHEAERLCRQAEEALNAARQRWAALRTKALDGDTIDTKEVQLDIERGVSIFASRTYIHSDLDRTNIESLSNRFERDTRDLREANRLSRALRQGIDQEPQNTEELIGLFERLRAAEENLDQTTLALIERDRVASISRPGTSAERYPRQAAILRSIREQIESLQRAELTVPDLAALRQIMAQRSQREDLLGRLDRERRFSN